jgi:molybdenum cofactor synthesis domain-containing protein
MLTDNGFEVDEPVVVPDDKPSIVGALEAAVASGIDLVVTTGGTGLSQRDVTPEATAEVAMKIVPGLSELMRAEGAKKTPLAVLSRGIAGSKGKTLLINLPGSPKGAAESLAAVLPVIPHALDVLSGPAAH